MTLVDTCVWIDHLHQPDETLQSLLDSRQVVVHPFVIGEIACGNIRERAQVLLRLTEQSQAETVENQAVLNLIESSRLYGRGLNLVDAHLLASAMTGKHHVMTGDRRLAVAAIDLGIQVVD